MKVLVTRPKADAEDTARQLAARGHDALIAPLLETQFHAGPPVSLEGVQAVLATSANGVRALAGRTPRRDVPLFAVGPQTEQAARDAGFAQVRNADGDAGKLTEAAARWARPDDGALLHVHGGQGGQSRMAERLRGLGFTVREERLYAVMPLSLPWEAADALREGMVDAALFYSPRSAEIFRRAASAAELPTAGLIALCISAATASALAPLVFREIRVAVAPNQDALLACLKDTTSN
jgi:uroporphyrinogen-III synthase